MARLRITDAIRLFLDARALFERVIPKFPPERARPLWERWARYEYQYGDLEGALKLEKRMAEVYASGARLFLYYLRLYSDKHVTQILPSKGWHKDTYTWVQMPSLSAILDSPLQDVVSMRPALLSIG